MYIAIELVYRIVAALQAVELVMTAVEINEGDAESPFTDAR